MGLTDGRTFIGLLHPEGDSAACEAVRRELDLDAIALKDPDAEAPHLAGDVAEHRVVVVEPYAKHRVREGLDHLTLDQLALYHRVHRATVARWLAQARSALIAHLENELDGALSSVMAELHSRTSLSLHRLLAEEGATS